MTGHKGENTTRLLGTLNTKEKILNNSNTSSLFTIWFYKLRIFSGCLDALSAIVSCVTQRMFFIAKQ